MLDAAPQPGPRNCLRCDKEFPSVDRIKNRICPRCAEVNRAVRLPRVLPSWVNADGRVVEVKPDSDH